jgi:hypothetical protein
MFCLRASACCIVDCFLGWFLVLAGASQYPTGLWLTPLPLLLLLLPQLLHPNSRFGHD